MRILIAGGCGYVGSRLIPALIDRGYDVDVIDLLWFGNQLPKGINVLKKDIFSCTEKDLKPYEQVIFLAGVSNDPMAALWPSENFIQNAASPSYLAYIAREAGVKRYIYASSCSVYGYSFDELHDETQDTVCDFPYGISKLQGERAVTQLQNDNFSTISLRKGTVSGYSSRMRFDLIINAMFKSAVTTDTITVNNPSIWRPILDIRDCVSAYIRAIQADYSISGIYNISSDNYTVGQVGDIVKNKLDSLFSKKHKLVINNIAEFRNYKVNINKSATYIGFKPEYTVKDIVEDLYDHIDLFKNYTDKKYYNVEVLKDIKHESPSIRF